MKCSKKSVIGETTNWIDWIIYNVNVHCMWKGSCLISLIFPCITDANFQKILHIIMSIYFYSERLKRKTIFTKYHQTHLKILKWVYQWSFYVWWKLFFTIS